MFQSRDRRYHSRLLVDQEPLAHTVAFHCASSILEGNIVDVSKDGLRIECSSTINPAQLDELMGLSEIHLAGRPEGLKLKIVNTSIPIGASGLTVHCKLIGDDSRAYIWDLLHDLCDESSAKSTPAAAPILERVPERGIYTEESRLKRLQFVEEKTNNVYYYLRKSNLNATRLVGNIENHIGGVEIPVGLAGPLMFRGKSVQEAVYAPFATSEGALVASASRGALLLNESGGVTTRVLAQRMIRVPMFVMDSLDSAILFSEWLRDHVPELQTAVAKVSSHAKLASVDITLSGRIIHASFVYSTGDAAGQNMTTAATWQACQWAIAQVKYFRNVHIENFVIDSGMSGDKKVNFKSFIEGRGTRVIADAFIPGAVLERVMKVTTEQLLYYHSNALSALIQTGGVGSNVNVANTIAAIFAATGQDIASVHESSIANFHIEKVDGGIYASMLLPSLIVGTVGGGSGLPVPTECLKMMGCFGAHKAGRLAEIIAGYCLALDLSTVSALVNGTFVKAHERLGRNRPVAWFKQTDLNIDFFARQLRTSLGQPDLMVTKLEAANDFNATDSIITELTAKNNEKFLGLFPYKVFTHNPLTGESGNIEIIVKSKPTDDEVIMLASKMAGMCNSALGDLYERFKAKSESTKCQYKELAIYGQTDPRFTANVPRIYGSFAEPGREAFVILMERLRNLQIMGKADEPEAWTDDYRQAAIRGMAELHSIWYGREAELRGKEWIGFVHDSTSMQSQAALFRELIRHAAIEFPALVEKEHLIRNYDLIESMDSWYPEIDQMKKTLIHNDFNPRNIGIRAEGDGLRLVAYDWELATIQIPQRDLAEFLSYVITDNTTDAEITAYIELHRSCLETASGQSIDPAQWRRGFELALQDFAVNRLSLYFMAHTFKHYTFIDHLFRNHSRLLEGEKRRGQKWQ